MQSKLLIQDEFDEFNYENLFQNIQKKNLKNEKNIQNSKDVTNYLNQIKKTESNENSDEMSIIELIDDKNYTIHDNEVKYKIFEDISSICKSNCSNLELILNFPQEHNIVSINKIKLSNGLSKYIKNIYIMSGNNVILTKEELLNNNTKLLKIMELNDNNNIINSSDKSLHIVLDKDSLNKIINKNIFVNYSYTILKNKLKFI
jgi:hypothetical protein